MNQEENRREDALNPQFNNPTPEQPEGQTGQEANTSPNPPSNASTEQPGSAGHQHMPENVPQNVPQGEGHSESGGQEEAHYPPRGDAGRPIGAAPEPQATPEQETRPEQEAIPEPEPTPAQRTSHTARAQAGVAAGAFRRGEFMQDAAVDSAANSDDRLIALLSYVTQVFIPVVMPLIVLLSESSKKRPFQRYHAVQSLALTLLLVLIGIAATLGGLIIQIIPVIGQLVALLLFCLSPIAYLMAVIAMFYYGYQAYQGKRFAIPGLTTFLRDQGWLA